MKGMVFTEFVEMVEDVFTPEVADKMITQSGVPNGGSYTAVGKYDYKELMDMVAALSSLTSIPSPQLVKNFGHYLLPRFKEGHSDFFASHTSTFDFLESVNDTIHREVLKLYPDAELPHFETLRSEDVLVMNYRSKRPLADLAEGLIEASFNVYNEAFIMHREDSKQDDYHISSFSLQSLGKR